MVSSICQHYREYVQWDLNIKWPAWSSRLLSWSKQLLMWGVLDFISILSNQKPPVADNWIQMQQSHQSDCHLTGWRCTSMRLFTNDNCCSCNRRFERRILNTGPQYYSLESFTNIYVTPAKKACKFISTYVVCLNFYKNLVSNIL